VVLRNQQVVWHKQSINNTQCPNPGDVFIAGVLKNRARREVSDSAWVAFPQVLPQSRTKFLVNDVGGYVNFGGPPTEQYDRDGDRN